MSSDVSSPAGIENQTSSKMSSSEKASQETVVKKFPCDLCPYVAKTTESLANHSKNHIRNPDAMFVCKKCPFYCTSKIELGIHSMVHAMQRRSIDSSDAVPEKRRKVDTESSADTPPQARSRMSPFKKSSSVSPTSSKSLKKTSSTAHLKEKHRGSLDSAIRASPTKSLWKVKLGAQNLLNHGNGTLSEDDSDYENIVSSSSKAGSSEENKSKRRSSINAATCPLCPQTFTAKGNITKHMKYHVPSADRPHKCTFCSFSCTFKGSLSNHIALHLESEGASEVTYTPDDAASLEEEDEFGDDEGGAAEKKDEAAEKEDEAVEKEDEVAVKMFRCEKCPYSTVHRRLIKKHRDYHFPSADRQACCPHCSYYVTAKHALHKHLAVHKDVQSEGSRRDSVSTIASALDDSQNGDADVEDNESVITTKSDASESGKSKKKVHRCEICPYTTRHWNLMQTHNTQHTPSEDRKARCDYCPYYVTVKHALTKHLAVHKEHRDKKELFEKMHKESMAGKLDSSQNDGDDDEEIEKYSNTSDDEADLEEKLTEGDSDKSDEEEDGDTEMELEEEDQPEEKVYACNICPYKTIYRRLIKVHTSKHVPSPTRKAKCDYCPYYGTVKSLLKKHMMVHQEYRDLQDEEAEVNESVKEEESEPAERDCKLCPYVATSAHSLKRHTEFHCSSEERQVQCPYCPYFVKSQARLANHVIIHKEHSTDVSGVIMACEVCPYKTSSSDALEGHMKHHVESKEHPHKCPKCSYYAKNVGQIERHLKLHPLDRVPKDGKENNDVSESGKKRKSKGGMPTAAAKLEELNVEVIKQDGFHRCAICPYKTEHLPEFKKHSSHHSSRPEWPTKCRFCPFYAANFNGISRHIPMHPEYREGKSVSPEKDEVMEDEMEDEEFDTEDETVDEVEEDDDEESVKTDNTPGIVSYQYRCNICPFFGPRNKMKKHMEMHNPCDKRPAKCPFCPFYVKSSASLGSHLNIHNRARAEDDNTVRQRPDANLSSDEDMGTDDELETKAKGRPKVNKYQCTQCPYVARKQDLDIHMVMHKPNPRSIYQCHYCSFAHANKGALHLHFKVHKPGYVQSQMAQFKVHLDINQINQMVDLTPSSPAKSDISDVSDCDVLEMANIKQQLITAKIISAPVSEGRFISGAGDFEDDRDCLMEGLMVDKNGKMKMGLFRTMFRCQSCPYTSIFQENLQLHEAVHKIRTGKYKCSYCSFKTDRKILRNRHNKLHSLQYVPGAGEVNDYECNQEEETDEGEQEEDEEDMEVSFKETPAEDGESKVENKPDNSKQLPKAAIKSPSGNSIKIRSKPLLSMMEMPSGIEYYVRQDRASGESFLERASVKKWCCEKCPYATMDKDRFENHSMLHASHQRNVCEFCDYSVPVFSFLLEHRKLHLQPNPNLLSMQSVTNLLSLPEMPADLAAAANFPGESDDPISQYGAHDDLELYENSDQYTEPRKLYHCDRCPYTNVRRDNLLSHMRFHMTKSELKCDYCDYSVGKHELLVQHVRVHFVDPDLIKLDLNRNSVVSKPKPTDDAPKFPKPVLRESAKMNTTSSDTNNATKGTKKNSNIKVNSGETDVDAMNNNSFSWICQYCDRAFCESDRLLRHEMQHLIGQRI